MKKQYLWMLLTILGAIAIIAISLGIGSWQYNNICQQIKTYSAEELSQPLYIYGFERCVPGGIAASPTLMYIMLTVFIIECVLYIAYRQGLSKDKSTIFFLCFISFLCFVVLDQFLLNTIKYVSVKGWQDAGWTLSYESSLMYDLRDIFKRPTAFPISFAAIIVFSAVSCLGAFIGSLVWNAFINKMKVWLSIPLYVVISIIIQVFIYLVTFPLLFWIILLYTA